MTEEDYHKRSLWDELVKENHELEAQIKDLQCQLQGASVRETSLKRKLESIKLVVFRA